MKHSRYASPPTGYLAALAVAVAVALLLLAGCGPPITVAPLTPADIARMQAAGSRLEPSYRINPGDTLQIRYPFHSEMDQEALVEPDGKITATGVGILAVGGLGTAQVEALLKEKSSARLRNPEVIVTIRRVGDKTVYVGGEVWRPGVQIYRDGLTPLQAIMAAGGFRPTARIDSVILFRPGADGQHVARKLDLERVVNNGEREPLDVAPNDVLFVPRTPIANANVWVQQHVTDMFPFLRIPMPVPY